MASELRASASRSGWRLVALIVLGSGGSFLAGLPHVIAWVRSGDVTYIPDGDGLLYLAWSRAVVLGGGWHLTDGIHSSSGAMMHPWLLFVPPARLAHGLGLGMSGLGVVWRILAGWLIAWGLFVAIRPSARRFGVALGLTTFLLCDSGMMFGQLFRREFEILSSLASGSHSFLTGVPRLMPHFRVVTPGLALPALLFHLGAVLRARLGSGLGWRTLAVGSFGLLFYVYFYYWTMVGLGLVLAILLDRAGRRLYLVVLVGGLLLGVPALWEANQAKRANAVDWLWRTNKFVEIGHFDELLWPKGLILTWLATAVWVFKKRPELIYPWCCTGAGLICLNHQILTGLQIENDHWSGAYGMTFSVLLAGLIAPLIDRALDRGQTWRWALATLLVGQVAIGFGLRGLETMRSDETLDIKKLYDRWHGDASFRQLPTGAVVAGDPAALFLAAGLSQIRPLSCRLVEFSARTDDVELDERLILNAFLTGVERSEMRRRVELPPGSLSWEASATRSSVLADRQRLRRLALIESIWTDAAPWIERFEVDWVVLPPQSEGAHLAGIGHRERSGVNYRVWRLFRPLNGFAAETSHRP